MSPESFFTDKFREEKRKAEEYRKRRHQEIGRVREELRQSQMVISKFQIKEMLEELKRGLGRKFDAFISIDKPKKEKEIVVRDNGIITITMKWYSKSSDQLQNSFTIQVVGNERIVIGGEEKTYTNKGKGYIRNLQTSKSTKEEVADAIWGAFQKPHQRDLLAYS